LSDRPARKDLRAHTTPEEVGVAAASAGLHEPAERLERETIDHHRAIVSIMEELEAVDWYHQRADATDDPELAAVLVHNRDEEKEHAVMTLEWLRRRDPVLDRHLRTYLFREGDIIEIEHEAEHEDGDARDDVSLGIGSLRGEGAL
jgi:ferritin-like protein